MRDWVRQHGLRTAIGLSMFLWLGFQAMAIFGWVIHE